jgi:hypothetical protein
MKNLLFGFVVLVSAGLCLVGCSNDDSDNDDGICDDGYAVSVNFLLQDESGTEKYTFKEGENIIFRLDIINHDTVNVVLPSIVEIIGNDIFQVYGSNGKDYGKPWDELTLPDFSHVTIGANGTKTYLCPWYNNPESELSWKPHYLNIQIDKLRPLPKGDYYSEFKIRLDNNRVVTCQKTFKIE